MNPAEEYDAIVIGTGQGGKPLAAAFAQAGQKTAIIEKGRVGGTCVVEGCTPTKTMVASARVAHLAGRAADYGVITGPVSVDLEVVRKRKRDIVDSWSAGSQQGLERHEHLNLIFGEASFTGPRTLRVTTDGASDGSAQSLTAEKIFINAGARPSAPPIPGLDSVPYLDSTSIMELGEAPSHLIVLGGGFVGLEFGQMFHRFGSRVTIVEGAPRLISREDEDVSKELEKILREEGIEILTDAMVQSIGLGEAGGVEVAIDGITVEGTHLLVATGRVPNSDLLDPAAAGILLDERGFIAVNERMETSVPGVYALGDITGAPPFTHIAYDDYRILKRIHLGGEDANREGRPVPYTLFTDPQLGRIGLTEREAREQGLSVRVATLPMSRVARAIETDETRGFMKAVVDDDTDLILGAAVLGIEGGEVATVLQMAMMGGVPYTAIKDGVFSHPTLSESLNNLFMAMDA
ncbi:MAG: mercuric reductase [Gemmatimonadota bacterium]